MVYACVHALQSILALWDYTCKWHVTFTTGIRHIMIITVGIHHTLVMRQLEYYEGPNVNKISVHDVGK